MEHCSRCGLPRTNHAGACPNCGEQASGSIFVGREQELRLLHNAVAAATAGRAAVVLLAGEPGIGKTTLAGMAADAFLQQSGQVYWGRCYEWEGAPAFWPWIQIIRAYAQQHIPAHLLNDLGSGAAVIRQAIPEIGDRLPGLPEPTPMDGEQARFRLFDSITRFLGNAAERQPLLLVLDDLQWADAPSLLLLQFVARELEQSRLLIVATYRDVGIDRRHPLTVALAELARAPGTQRMQLRGLAVPEIAHLLAHATGSLPAPELAEAIQRETGGNAFFTSEVVRLLAAEDALAAAEILPWATRLPDSVRDVITRQLNRLSSTCNSVLALASVIGYEFSLPLLERAGPLPAEAVLDALDEALSARLVQGEAGYQRYRFTHALVQETIYADLGAGQRIRSHAAVGQALQQLYAGDIAPYYGELAHHFTQAALLGTAQQAVEYALLAGRRAMEHLAWETAIAYYQRALGVLDTLATADPLLRCDVLLALGSAQYHSALDLTLTPEGRRAFLRAAEIATALGDFERMARAALGFAGLAAFRTPGGMQQVRLLEAALALAPIGDNILTARVMARLALDYQIVPSATERSAELGNAALAMAKRLEDPAVLATVLIARYPRFWRPDCLEERLHLASEARQAAEMAGDTAGQIWSHMFAAYALYERGDGDRFEQESDAVIATARQARIPYFNLIADVFHLGRLVKDGRFAAADDMLAKIDVHTQTLMTLYSRAIFLFRIRREQGRLEEIGMYLHGFGQIARAAEDPFDWQRAQVVDLMLLLRAIDLGRTDDARASFERYAARDFTDLAFNSYWLALVALLSEACVALGDERRAARLYEILLPYADLQVNPSSGTLYLGSAAWYLGNLATLLRRWDAAHDHFHAALAANERMHAPSAVAWTRYAWAAMLTRRGGDAAMVRDLLAPALETARVLGMTSLNEQINHLETPGSLSPDLGLSPREREILRLITTGLSDREIAEALYISPRTVTTHVTNIFNKLGVNSRSAASALAVRRGIV